MLCKILEYCGYCGGVVRKLKPTKECSDLFKMDHKPIHSFRQMPDIQITENTVCEQCHTKIKEQKYVSTYSHYVFFFCKESCYLDWLHKKPPYITS